MSELRWHPFLQEWVITATHRQDRTFHPPDDYCPLCPTQPGGFPTEVPESTYEIVVFENRFPSLQYEPPLPAVAPVFYSNVERARGICEVILYTPDHRQTLAALPVQTIERLIYVWRDRYAEFSEMPGIKYVFIFENKGKEIGVTLSHPHGQLYAYPFIPSKLEREAEACHRYHDEQQRVLLLDIVEDELERGTRIVARSEGWVAFVPFFARYPYEVYIAPIQFHGDLLTLSASEVKGFAQILKQVLTQYDRLFGFSMPYVMAQHPRPCDGKLHAGWQFHVEFYPPYRTRDKLKYLAGSESGAGAFINDTLPEETARRLREA